MTQECVCQLCGATDLRHLEHRVALDRRVERYSSFLTTRSTEAVSAKPSYSTSGCRAPPLGMDSGPAASIPQNPTGGGKVTQAWLNRIGTAVPAHDIHAEFVDFARTALPDDRSRVLFDRMADLADIEHRFS